MNKKVLEQYKKLDYLCDCSHGRLREIINELVTELEMYSGEFCYDDLTPAEWASKIMTENESVGRIWGAIESAIRQVMHKAKGESKNNE